MLDSETKIHDNYAGGMGGAIFFEVVKSKLSEWTTPSYDLSLTSAAEIYNNGAKYGGAIAYDIEYDYNCGLAVLSGSKIHDNTAELGGGAFYSKADQVYDNNRGFQMDGGEVYSNHVTKGDGGVAYIDNGIFVMTGGTLGNVEYPNTASGNGGGAYIYGGTVTITGGTVAYNTADLNGGGIYLNKGTVTVSGGSIYSCFANGNGGGFYIGNGDVTISSSNNLASIDSNVALGNGGGVYLKTGSFTFEGGIIGENIATNGGGVYIEDGTVKISKKNMDTSIVENKVALNGGGIYLFKGTVKISGGNISHNTFDENCNPEDDNDGNGGGVYVHSGNVIISDGFIDCNQAYGRGGGIYLETGSVEMTGGLIQENEVSLYNGGGIYVFSGDFTVSGGSIVNNSSPDFGGGICVNKGNVFISGKAEIGRKNSPNTAEYGGGVYVYEGNVEMTGGQIDYNTADLGGGVYVHTGKVEMTGGQIGYNTAKSGGGVYISDGRFEFSNSTILNNAASGGNGGGAYIAGEFIMTGGSSLVESNTAVNGGGVYVANGNATMNSGTIQSNSATGNGGGICINSSSSVSVTISSGNILDNSASSYGGGLFINLTGDGTSQVTIGTTGHTHGKDADDHSPCPNIKRNTATTNGGGIEIKGNAVLDILCGLLSGNTAGSAGTGIGTGINQSGGSITIEAAALIKDKIRVTSGVISIAGAAIENDFTGRVETDLVKIIKHAVFSEDVTAVFKSKTGSVVLSNPFIQAGYGFVAWHTGYNKIDKTYSDNGINPYSVDDEYSGDKDIELYAEWVNESEIIKGFAVAVDGTFSIGANIVLNDKYKDGNTEISYYGDGVILTGESNTYEYGIGVRTIGDRAIYMCSTSPVDLRSPITLDIKHSQRSIFDLTKKPYEIFDAVLADSYYTDDYKQYVRKLYNFAKAVNGSYTTETTVPKDYRPVVGDIEGDGEGVLKFAGLSLEVKNTISIIAYFLNGSPTTTAAKFTVDGNQAKATRVSIGDKSYLAVEISDFIKLYNLDVIHSIGVAYYDGINKSSDSFTVSNISALSYAALVGGNVGGALYELYQECSQDYDTDGTFNKTIKN